MSTKTRFEEEAKGNSEMAYSMTSAELLRCSTNWASYIKSTTSYSCCEQSSYRVLHVYAPKGHKSKTPSGQSPRTPTFSDPIKKQNCKCTLADTNCGQIWQAHHDWLRFYQVLQCTSDWMKKWHEFLSQSCSLERKNELFSTLSEKCSNICAFNIFWLPEQTKKWTMCYYSWRWAHTWHHYTLSAHSPRDTNMWFLWARSSTGSGTPRNIICSGWWRYMSMWMNWRFCALSVLSYF